jgi:pimeloyl-ACP methyl ester carboxylesterase
MRRSDDAGRSPRFPYLDDEERAFGLCAEALFYSERSIVADDGVPLSVYEAGDPARPTVVLINPLGISCLFTVRLAHRLAERFHVLTWETRGLPNYFPSDDRGGGPWDAGRHCRDLAVILGESRCRADVIVSYCSGACIALFGLAHGIVAAGSLCLVSPSLEMPGTGGKTDYQRTVLPLLSRIDREGRRMAALVRVLLQQAGRKHLSGADYELSVINNLPFRRDEWTYRYAQLQAAGLRIDAAALLQRISIPAAIIHDREDELVHADTVEAVAALLRHARLSWVSGGGHFAIYKSREMQDRILEFVSGVDARSGS